MTPPPPHHRRHLRTAIVCICGAIFMAGCVDRRFFITSEPSGATVHLNDADVGATPVEVNFTWFGAYDIRVNKAGYEPLVTKREAKAPLHEVPGFDLVAMLIPVEKKTHIHWHFELEPADDDAGGLLERASEMRAEIEAERQEADAPPEEDQADSTPE